MTTEAQVVAKIELALKRQLPGVVVFKLNDYSSANIPDLAINYKQETTWVEVKLLKPKETTSKFKQHFQLSQLASNQLLWRQGQVYYFIAYDKGEQAVIANPNEVNKMLEYDPPNLDQLINLSRGDFNDVVDYLIWLVRP